MTRALFWIAASPALLAGWRAGSAAVDITPRTPTWLTGFAARTAPSSTVTSPLFAKALAVRDDTGAAVVIVTVDLLGLTREITTEVAARLERRFLLKRAQVVFNASHTHSGPSVWPRLHLAPDESPTTLRQVEDYGKQLIDQLERVAAEAYQQAEAVEPFSATGTATFAINRRVEHLKALRPGRAFPAPVRHDVPVVALRRSDGTWHSILFGYACHNTTLTGDTNEINGDYAGYAQRALERDLPRSRALFATLTAGDQRAMPRGTRALAEQHGESLAAAVRSALRRAVPLRGEIASLYREITLEFAAHTRETYLAESQSTDPFAARRGRRMLYLLDQGAPPWETAFPLQAIRFGSGATWLFLAGEVVVDYWNILGKDDAALVVAGYSNDLPGYIPSRRVMREGGYEAGDSMMYFNQPGWWLDDVEDRVLAAAREMLARIRR